MISEYDNFAEEFSKTRQYPWPEFEYIFNIINKSKKPNILDIGCGNSRLYNYLSTHNFNHKYTGLDISNELIALSKKKYPQNLYVTCNMENISSYLSTSYDYIISIAAIHHLTNYRDQIETLKQIKQLLAPKGLFIFTVWNLLSEYNQQKYNHPQENQAWNIPFSKEKYPRHYFAFDIDYLHSVLEESGFIIKELKYFNGDKETSKNIISICQ